MDQDQQGSLRSLDRAFESLKTLWKIYDIGDTTSGYGMIVVPSYHPVPRSQGTISASQMDSALPPVSASPLTSISTRLAEPRLKPRYSRALACSECRRRKLRCCHQPSTRASQDSYLARARAAPLLTVDTQFAAPTQQVSSRTLYQSRQEFSDALRNRNVLRGTDYSRSSLGYSVGPETRSSVGPSEPQSGQPFGL